MVRAKVLDKGKLSFTVESRVLRELGERLVKEPEVAFVELIKNAHDADATRCMLALSSSSITVSDNGDGMTFEEFRDGWMRIGTGAKAGTRQTRRFKRFVTGEKGIGRFAVRFLGRALKLKSVADDRKRGVRTVLTAEFNWPKFDRYQDLGRVQVPYTLQEATETEEIGTHLTITKLRPPARDVDLDRVRSASLSVVSPFQALLRGPITKARTEKKGASTDPGFALEIDPPPDTGEDADVAKAVLENAVLRAVVELRGSRLKLEIAGREGKRHLTIRDAYENSVGDLYADIRFFPDRKGTFAGMPVDGQKARWWVKRHQGVAVFDRRFRVLPYGTERDDWLTIAADRVRNARDPRSSIAKKHFPMSKSEQVSTELNWMLRLPHPRQLVGVVRVAGRRDQDDKQGGRGLIAAADREGFVNNAAFKQLWDIVRGAVEAIAHVDREVQIKEERAEQAAELRSLRVESRKAIEEIRRNPRIRPADKKVIVDRLIQTQSIAEEHEERVKETEARLEIMSLLGVVAGFMTHEFGVAMDELQKARSKIIALARHDPSLKEAANAIEGHMTALKEFVTYTQGYVMGAMTPPERPYPARHRIKQVVRLLSKYAKERSIEVRVQVPDDLMAPLVPMSLYGGVALNLYTNALKAVMAKAGSGDRVIEFTAENDDEYHVLTASDTGIGIPGALRSRVFDPLFTTTASNRDPLGSGLGLGLTLVKRAVETYGGTAKVVDPPEGFATSVRIRIPLSPN